MLTFMELVELLKLHRDLDECVGECLHTMSYDFVRNTPMMAGRAGKARDVHSTYTIHQRTTEVVGTCGFETLLERLPARPPDEAILRYHIDAPMRIFQVFTTESGELIGCIGVDRRNAEQELEKWRLDSQLGIKRR